MDSASTQNGKGAFANTQTDNSKKRKRKQHQKDRASAYREVKGTEYSDERTKQKMAGLGVGPNGIRSKLFAGVTSPSGAVAHLGTIAVHQAIPLPITSRVGFATCAFARALSNYRGFEIPNVHVLYRAFLGIFEAKLRRAKIKYPAVNVLMDDCRDFSLSPDWIEVMNTATIVPEPVFSIINSLGILKMGDEIYLPVMAKDLTTRKGTFTPTPEIVTLSSLRRVVEALASPRTPRDVRDHFISNNPIPGCRFAGRLLANPDDIIPRNYSSADLFRDIAEMTNVLQCSFSHMSQ